MFISVFKCLFISFRIIYMYSLLNCRILVPRTFTIDSATVLSEHICANIYACVGGCVYIRTTHDALALHIIIIILVNGLHLLVLLKYTVRDNRNQF